MGLAAFYPSYAIGGAKIAKIAWHVVQDDIGDAGELAADLLQKQQPSGYTHVVMAGEVVA
jgi:hypothetical protein